MNLKNNLKSAKEEFSNDEKMLESIFRLEAVFKKYKLLFILIAITLIAVPTGLWIKSYLIEQKALQTTALFNQYQENKDPQTLQAIQKQSPTLYEFIALSNALKEQDSKLLSSLAQAQNSFITHYATYQLSSLKEEFSQNQKLGEFNNLALIQEAYLQIQKNNHTQAMHFLNQILPSSDLREWALRIGHYGITR